MAFPTVVRRATAVSATSNAAGWTPSWTWTTNTAISSGDIVRWVAIISVDGVPDTITASGWSDGNPAPESDGTTVSSKILYQDTTGAYAASAAPSLVIGIGAFLEQFSGVLLAFKFSAGSTIGWLLASASSGSSTNSDPPSLTNSTGASRDLIVVATRSGDSTVVATAAPTNYSNLTSRAGGGTGGASTNTAERQITVASGGSENPGVFTSANEQWVSSTFAVYEIAAASGLTGDLSATLDAATISSAAKLAISSASGGGTLGAATVSSSAKLALQSTLSATLGAATMSSAGRLALQGSLSGALGAATLSASGSSASAPISGSLSGGLDDVTLAGSGALAIKASVAVTLSALIKASSGGLLVRGSLSGTLGALTGSGSAKLAIGSSVTVTLSAVSASAGGTLPIKGNLSGTLGSVSLAAAGGGGHFGFLFSTLGGATGSSAGSLKVQGALSAELTPLQSTALAKIVVSGQSAALLDDAGVGATATLGQIASPPPPEPAPYERPYRKPPWVTPSSRNPQGLPSPEYATRSSHGPLLLDGPSPFTPSSRDPQNLRRPTFRKKLRG